MTPPLVLVHAETGRVGVLAWGYNRTGHTDRTSTRDEIQTAIDDLELTGRASLGRLPMNESNLRLLLNVLEGNDARLDGCRRDGCENRTDRGDGLCGLHAEVAEDVSARIRRTA